MVRRPDGLLGFGNGASVPVDWLVVMRRFDAAAQLDRMAENGELRPELAGPLAERIADLHARAEARFDHGGAAGLARAIDITAGNLQSHASEIGSDAVGRWTRRARAALRAHTALLDRRRAAGKVRACHGDLHLRNICLLDGRPTPFDAIEFDPDLACIDVLYDLAFLLMDAHARGLERFGCTVFNKYLDLRQEEDGLAALPLFLSVRAAVRAQVNILTAGQAHPAKQKELLREAARYLALARELLEVVPPRLVAIGGLSGTGKSSLAHRLAPALGRVPGARVLRTDVLRKRAAGVRLETRLPAASYTPEASAATYRELEACARCCLAAGQAVIADAVFSDPGERSRIEAIARECDAPFQGLWLEAPLETLRERVTERSGDASDATAEVVDAQARRSARPAEWFHLDAAMPIGQVERSAGAALGIF